MTELSVRKSEKHTNHKSYDINKINNTQLVMGHMSMKTYYIMKKLDSQARTGGLSMTVSLIKQTVMF